MSTIEYDMGEASRAIRVLPSTRGRNVGVWDEWYGGRIAPPTDQMDQSLGIHAYLGPEWCSTSIPQSRLD